MFIILVRLDIQISYDNPTLFGPGNRYLAAKLIFLVILTFADAIHLGFMETVDLVGAVLFLMQDLMKD